MGLLYAGITLELAAYDGCTCEPWMAVALCDTVPFVYIMLSLVQGARVLYILLHISFTLFKALSNAMPSTMTTSSPIEQA